LIYYFITDISGTTVPIFKVAMNGRNSKVITLRYKRYAWHKE